ncbi:MAG: UbiA family prenyltransferase [Gemmatimonadetes bacterium]|nr:UbiA family prenyltransferase [Gemmatimonadota bacterium]
MRTLYNLVRLARPGQWIKNLFVLAALVFSRKVADPAARGAAVAGALVALAAFCLASSAVYAFNDVLDRREDTRHPTKRRRPVAAGDLGVGTALAWSALLAAGALALASALPPRFLLVVAAYLVLTAAYALGLKRLAVLDVLVIAAGFVLRAYGGGAAIGVRVSPWLVLCTLTLALFLGFAKRQCERAALGEAAAGTRPLAWHLYDEKALGHMMTVSAALALVTYMLYTVSPETVERAGHPWMCLTVLPVVYAVFRFHGAAVAGRTTGPVEMVRRDPAFVAALGVWAAMVAVLLFAV